MAPFTDVKIKPFCGFLVMKKGTPVQRDEQRKVYKIEWRWWWSSSEDNLSSYTVEHLS
jgi:hypothetical protein